MGEMMDIKTLGEYQRKIDDGVATNIKDSITKLTDTFSMLKDLGDINNSLMELVQEQQVQIDSLNIELKENRNQVDEKNELIESLKKRESEYRAVEINALRVANLVDLLNEEKNVFELERECFAKEKEDFEEEKDKLIQEKDDAEVRAKRLSDDRNAAIRSRDEAIAEKVDLEKEILNKKNSIIELNNKVNDLEQELRNSKELVAWYKNYAAATDKKVISFYQDSKKELNNHYYYYLNDPSKLEEIREHFPEYRMNQKQILESESYHEEQAGSETEIPERTKKHKTEEAVQKVNRD